MRTTLSLEDGGAWSQLNSKKELQCSLQQPRRHRTHDLAKARATDVTVDHCRAKELRMIEGIESFEAELK